MLHSMAAITTVWIMASQPRMEIRREGPEASSQRVEGSIALISLVISTTIIVQWLASFLLTPSCTMACLSFAQVLAVSLVVAILISVVILLLLRRAVRVSKLDARRRSYALKAIAGFSLLVTFSALAIQQAEHSEPGGFLFDRDMLLLLIGISVPLTILDTLIAAGVIDVRRQPKSAPNDSQPGN